MRLNRHPRLTQACARLVHKGPVAHKSGYLSYGAFADASAYFSRLALYLQHTSTVFPPNLTLIGLSSRSQSQAAQVFLAVTRAMFELPVETHHRIDWTRSQGCQILEPLNSHRSRNSGSKI